MEPEPEWLDYPSLLDLPRPRLRAYRPETTIAEKLHAMVELGTKNSRMRDFFDVQALAARVAFDGAILVRAIRATFDRRRTQIPEDPPVALTPAFAEVEGKRTQWAAFLRKSGLSGAATWLEGVARDLLAVLVEEAAHGTKAIRMDRWRMTPVEVPPEDEQHAIAAFLNRETARIDTLSAKIRDAIDRLKELRTALISAAVTGKIDVRDEVASQMEAPCGGLNSVRTELTPEKRAQSTEKA